MPTITINAQFLESFTDVELDITQEELDDLNSGKKKYYDFLFSGEGDSGEWIEGDYFVVEE